MWKTKINMKRSNKKGSLFGFLCNHGARGGDSHIKREGMFVVSPRGVNFGFWSHLGWFWAKRHHI